MTIQPWVKSYPPDVREKAPLDLSSVQSVLEKAAERFGSQPALEFMGKRTTYAELEALANRAALGFQKLGVGPGVHVGLFLPNTPHYIIAFFGVLKAGGTVVNYSPLDALHTLQHKIEDSETDILVGLDLAALYPQAEKLLTSTRLKTLVVGEFAEMTAAPAPVKAQMTAAGMLAEVKHDDRRLAFRDLIDNDGRYTAHPLGDVKEALAVIAYTGGTTGTPKGAMLTHANLTAACSLYMEVMTRSGADSLRVGEERFLCILPLFHIYSLTVVMLLGFRLGGGARPASAFRSGRRGQGHRRQEDHRLHGRADHACRASERARRRVDGLVVAPAVRLGRSAAAARRTAAVRESRRLPADRRLGNDRNRADRNLHPAREYREARLLRDPLPHHRDEVHRCRQP